MREIPNPYAVPPPPLQSLKRKVSVKDAVSLVDTKDNVEVYHKRGIVALAEDFPLEVSN